jgi:plastocyanin
MNTLQQLRRLGFLLIFALLGGCASEHPEAPPPPRPTTAPSVVRVTIDNFRFDPETITVPAGATVVWTNHDDVPHTVTANTKSFGSGALDTDEQFSQTFSQRGQFDYYCAVHPHMTGRVIVK